MKTHVMAAAILPAVLLASGCATVTSGTSQTVTIDSNPPGALCRLTRGEDIVGVINPTPGSITIGKDKDNIDISCEKDGYHVANQVMSSTFQGWTLGNVLLGGIIGIAIDAGSGAMSKYPGSILINLMPDSFASVEERDAYFDRMAEGINSEFETVSADGQYTCEREICRSGLRKLIVVRDERLAEVESLRNASTVSVPVTQVE